MALVQHGHLLSGDPLGAGGPFSLADPQANRDLLGAAGFGDADVQEIDGAMHADSLDDYWEFQTSVSGPVATLVATLSADEQAAIKETLEPMVAPFKTDDGYDIPSLAIGVTAR
jgi:hypothetical protein